MCIYFLKCFCDFSERRWTVYSRAVGPETNQFLLFFLYLIQIVVNVKMPLFYFGGVHSVSVQLDQKIKSHQKQFSNCCKKGKRSYSHAFIKWFEVDAVLFVNQRCSFYIWKKNLQLTVCSVCFSCHYYNLRLSEQLIICGVTWCFCTAGVEKEKELSWPSVFVFCYWLTHLYVWIVPASYESCSFII